MSTWPKLSEELPGRDPCECQRCRATVRLTYWQECDNRDQPTRVFVVLCKGCADEIIEPHSRLYRDIDVNTPMPGAMPICADCRSRNGMTCLSPVAMFNGGPEPGLQFEPKGQMVHVCRSPRREGGWQYFAEGPVTKCSGKEAAACPGI
jgi:hypothetical protein